jgi:SAM-dependent methyltransferase
VKCFKIIEQVLGELYGKLPGSDQDKDRAIQAELRQLGTNYINLPANGALSYKSPVRRLAYVYKYVTSHANLVCNFLEHDVFVDIFQRSEVDVACIGGGPGSDLLGILKFMHKNNLNFRLTCALHDKDRAWFETWRDIGKKCECDFRLHTSNDCVDVTNKETWQDLEEFLQSDIFTFIYFMSEVYKDRDKSAEYFEYIFRNAKQGAIFLYVDNNNAQFYNWFDALADKHGIEIVERNSGTKYLPNDEQKDDLGDFFDKFGTLNHCRPKITANIAWRIGIKK